MHVQSPIGIVQHPTDGHNFVLVNVSHLSNRYRGLKMQLKSDKNRVLEWPVLFDKMKCQHFDISFRYWTLYRYLTRIGRETSSFFSHHTIVHFNYSTFYFLLFYSCLPYFFLFDIPIIIFDRKWWTWLNNIFHFN